MMNRFGYNNRQVVRVSDNCERRRSSLLRESLGWDSGFLTSEGLLKPEELVMVNDGFEISNTATQKDAKLSTKIAGSFKKMNICSQTKDKVKSVPKLLSSRQTNSNAAVGRTDTDSKIKNKTRKAHDSKRSQSSCLSKLTCFTSPAIKKTVRSSYESSTVTHKNTIPVLDFQCPASKERKFISQSATKGSTSFSSGPKRKIKSPGLRTPSPKIGFVNEELGSMQDESNKVRSYNLSPCVSTRSCLKVGKNLSREHDGRKVGSSCSKLKPNTACKKMNNAAAVKGSDDVKMENKIRTAQDSKMSQSGGLPKLTCFTTPTTQKFHHSDEPSSKNLSKRKVNPKNMKLVNSPSSVLHFPLASSSTSPASSIDGESSSSTIVTHQNTIPVLDFQSRDSEDVQSESRRQSFLRKSLAWDSEFSTSAGLLNPEELLMVNKGFKKLNLMTPKDVKTSKVTTKIGGSQSNALSCKKINNAGNAATVTGPDHVQMENKTRTAQDSNRSRSGDLPVLTCFTSPKTEKPVHQLHEMSFKDLSKSVIRKVNPENMKLVNSPSSVLHCPFSPSSPSPASSIDGESLSSTPVTRQNIIPVSDFQSQDSKQTKFISQNAVKSSGLRMPSPRIGFFDMEPGSMQDRFRYTERQFQSSNLSCVSTGNRVKVGKFPFTGNNWVNLSVPMRDRLKHIGLGPYEEYCLHSRTALEGKILSFDDEFYD